MITSEMSGAFTGRVIWPRSSSTLAMASSGQGPLAACSTIGRRRPSGNVSGLSLYVVTAGAGLGA